MSTDRIVAIVLAVLLVVSAGFAVNLNQKLSKSEDLVAATQEKLDDTKGELKTTSQDLLVAQDEADELGGDLARSESTVNDYSACVDRFSDLEYYKQGTAAAFTWSAIKSVYLCFANIQSAVSEPI